MRCVPPIRNDHVYPCDSDGYQNELLCTNSQTEYTIKINGLDDVLASCNAGYLVDCRNLIFFTEMISWAPWFSQVQSTWFLSVFLEHSIIYVLVVVLFSNLLCFMLMTYENIIILKTSRKKKLIKDKPELNHNIQWCPLINLLQSFIHNYDNTLRQYHKHASHSFRKTKIQSSRAHFVLFWQSKQKWHHFRTWRKMKVNNLSSITTLRLQSVTLELGPIERITLTCCLPPPFLRPFQCWPQTWDNSTEKPF